MKRRILSSLETYSHASYCDTAYAGRESFAIDYAPMLLVIVELLVRRTRESKKITTN